MKTEERPGFRKFQGYWMPIEYADWNCYLYLFGHSKAEEKLHFFKKLVGELWPSPVFEWDEWCDLFFGVLCGAHGTVEHLTGQAFYTTEKWWELVVASGAGSTGKSAKAAMWVLCQWLCAREQTTVVLTSTSMDQLKRRIWHHLLHWIHNCTIPLPLEPLPGDCEIRWTAGDKLSCIFGIPVKSGGEATEAIDRIKGLHNRRTFLVIDEMTSTPDAAFETRTNLRKGTLEHQTIGLGNATDPEDLHGRAMKPSGGRRFHHEVTPTTKFWLTEQGGCAVHFNGLDSPAIRDPQRFHFYINAEDIRLEQVFGGGESNPRYWSEVIGFWPIAGLTLNVMDAALFSQFHVEQDAIWLGLYEMGAAFDPAFEGGDRRILYPFKFGMLASGSIGLEFQAPVIVEIASGTDVRWIHYAIADAVQAHCEKYEINGRPAPIPPQNFTMDTTGEGGGIFSVMSGRWSPLIKSVEFGGAAEKTQVAPDRPVTYHELYGNKVTQIWYVFRRYVEGNQIRGLRDSETKTELCARERKMKNGKTVVVPKSEMKIGKARSPDKADSACIAAWFLYDTKKVVPAGMTGAGPMISLEKWNERAEKINEEDEFSYSDEMAEFV
jgi:hypothetical protein